MGKVFSMICLCIFLCRKFCTFETADKHVQQHHNDTVVKKYIENERRRTTNAGVHVVTLDEIVGKSNYDGRIRPHEYSADPEYINVGFSVISADDIRVNSMEFCLDFILRLHWHDPRLIHDHLDPFDVPDEVIPKVWLPDIYIVNAKKTQIHNTTKINQNMKIYGTGHINYSVRLTVVARCNIDLKLFPWDVQQCPIIMQSYSFTETEIQCRWWDDGQNGSTFIWKLKHRPMAQYDLHYFTLKNINVTYDEIDKNGNWSTVVALFSFKRLNRFWLLQTLAPSNIIVFISWIAFLIEADHAPARIYLGITCILTMSSIQGSINSALPQVSYVKTVDIYLLTGYLFVILALIEYAIVLLLNERVKKEEIFKKEKKLHVLKKDTIDDRTPLMKCCTKLRLCFHGNPFCCQVSQSAPVLVDRASILLFPSMYIIFNVIFWIRLNSTIDIHRNTGAEEYAHEMLLGL